MNLIGKTFIGLLTLAFTAGPGSLVSPPMSEVREFGATITRAKGDRERWKNQWTMDRTSIGGNPVLRFTEEGHGIRTPFKQEVRWTMVALWADTNPPVPLRSESAYSDSMGNLLTREVRVFDLPRKQVAIEKTDGRTGKTKRDTVSIPPDTLGPDGLAGILRGLDFDSTKPFEAHLLAPEGKVYNITLEVRGKEKVRTGEGEVECYKVELVPHLGVLNVFRGLFPKTYFWFQVDAPHDWVRYEGLEHGQGSPEVVMQRSRPAALSTSR